MRFRRWSKTGRMPVVALGDLAACRPEQVAARSRGSDSNTPINEVLGVPRAASRREPILGVGPRCGPTCNDGRYQLPHGLLRGVTRTLTKADVPRRDDDPGGQAHLVAVGERGEVGQDALAEF